MLIVFVVLYLLLTVAIGLWAARRVHNSRDFVVAGRSLPLYVVTAMVFASWFAAETVLSVSAIFAGSRGNLGAIVADPYGASFGLVIVALFFARAYYRMNLLTIGDFYRKRYGRRVEALASLAITASYVGWASAQLAALGLVFQALCGGRLPFLHCVLLGTAIVLCYTLWGGMWSVALTDLFQSAVIVVGLCAVAWLVADMAGGPRRVIAAAAQANKLTFWPVGGSEKWLGFAAPFMIQALGSIAQQDVFQRVASAKDESTAVWGTLIGGLAYFCFAFVPVFIVYAAVVTYPELQSSLDSESSRVAERVLPDLILERVPLWAQVMFFGALLSAVLSTASATLLAPSTLFTGNLLQPRFPHMRDRQFLSMQRVVLGMFTLLAMLFAINSDGTLYDMVVNSNKVTIVGALVPLVAGMFWKRATAAGAVISILLGLSAWGLLELAIPKGAVPPVLAGLAFAIVGVVAGSLASKAPEHAHAGH